MRFHRSRRETMSRSAKARRHLSPRRARTLEMLEGRELLAGDVASAWQNPIQSRDVNFDMRVTPHDALLVINHILANGGSQLSGPPVTPLSAGGTAKPKYVDVSGDGRVTPHDVLLVINALAATQLMLVHTYATDLAGNPITTIDVGASYLLVTDVRDTRPDPPEGAGVFSAAVDVRFNPALSTVNGALQFGPTFNFSQEQSFLPGRINSSAGSTSLNGPGAIVQRFWSVEMTATSPGLQTFMPQFLGDGVLNFNENNLYQRDELLTEDEIMYTGATLQITTTLPTLTVADVSQVESSGTFVFTVSLSPGAVGEVTVEFDTSDGSAEAGSDYDATSGTLTFAQGVTMLTVPVTVNDDDEIEGNETFFLNLFNVSGNAVIGDDRGQGTIVNDDSPPAFVVSDATAAGGTEDSVAVFTVSLTGQIDQPVSVGFATEDNTALAGVHYQAVSGIVQFVPGDPLSKTVPVTVFGSATPLPDLTFFLRLSSGSITIEDDLGVATIVTQGLSISDASVVEGNEGTTNAVFTVRLSRVSADPVTVVYSTEDGTATVADNDYLAKINQTLTFAPGDTQKLITVVVNGDMKPEGNERFTVRLSSAVGAPIFGRTGVGTIRNDDGDRVGIRLDVTDLNGVPLPENSALDVGDSFYLNVYVQDLEGLDPTGVAQAFLDISYPENLVTPDPGTLEWAEFYSNLQTGTFLDGLLDDFGASGPIPQLPPLPPFPPSFDPAAEQFFFRVLFTTLDVGLVNFVGSVDEDDLDDGHETLVYQADEPLNSDEINVQNRVLNIGENVIIAANVSAAENAGFVVFAVTRFLPGDQQATVEYRTTDGTAIGGQDYTAKSGVLTFAANDTAPQFVTVFLLDDLLDEDDETFFLTLENAVNATAAAAPAMATILDNDAPPQVNLSSASGPEGGNVVFAVNLTAASGRVVTVNYQTQDLASPNAATAGEDYVAATGSVTFQPGTTQAFITVQALGDVTIEPNEVFRLVLTGADHATLGTSQATGTITDVPPAGISGYVYLDVNNNGIKEVSEVGIGGAIVTATRNEDGSTTTAVTDANGAYLFPALFPGTYTITETQPGFYTDGRDTRFGVESAVNDRFVGVQLASGASETGFNFGERGVRAEFIAAFMNRRALFATAAVGGTVTPTLDMPGSTLNLQTGDLWVSFDGGWEGLRLIESTFNPAQGPVTMKLYNNALQLVGMSVQTAADRSVLYYNGQPGLPYFLKISGSNTSVSLSMSVPMVPMAASSDSTDADDEHNATSAAPVATPLAKEAPAVSSAILPMTDADSESLLSSASDEALAESEDWVLESLLA